MTRIKDQRQMKFNTRLTVALAACFIAIALPISLAINGGIAAVGETRHDPRRVALSGAETARVELAMEAGQVRLAGGASGLMDANFTYNVDAWKPKLDYKVTSREGVLTVVQSSRDTFFFPWDRNDGENQWDIQLTDEIPLDLRVDLGAGEGIIDLRGLNLTALMIETGAGTTEVDLRGDWQRDFTSTIEGGVGDTTLKLPKEVGVRVEVEQGIGVVNADGLMQRDGAYVNSAYDASEVTLQITLTQGVGEINLKLDE